MLHKWLTTNCYVRLGNHVWKQVLGIPMGFSCSPIWCNPYLMSYKIRFIQRLAKLGRVDIMEKFKHAFRYIDNLCWLNNGNAQIFLDPLQPRTSTKIGNFLESLLDMSITYFGNQNGSVLFFYNKPYSRHQSLFYERPNVYLQ